MKLNLAENICRLRKENNMTQEQLAEALGVSFAAVSKWERGVATPELNLITDMADLFDVSVDVLIGYQLRNNNKDAVIQRLKDYVHVQDIGWRLPAPQTEGADKPELSRVRFRLYPYNLIVPAFSVRDKR